EVGADRQVLRLAIPESADELVALRLDPANRPGFLRLHDLTLFDADQDCVWKWDGSKSLQYLRSNQTHFIADSESPGLQLVLEGDDPWFELPLGSEDLSRLRRGGVLEMTVSWPQASDSLLVIKRLLRREGQ